MIERIQREPLQRKIYQDITDISDAFNVLETRFQKAPLGKILILMLMLILAHFRCGKSVLANCCPFFYLCLRQMIMQYKKDIVATATST